MAPRCQEVTQVISKFAPPELALDWDNVGLLIGSPAAEVGRVLLALDLNEEVVEEAIGLEVELVITHHPVVFKPLKSLRFDRLPGRLIQKVIAHQINVFAAHTNLDIASGGVSDLLAGQLDLIEVEILAGTYPEKLYKLVVFVPKDYLEQVREALTAAGAGFVGRYSHCSFSSLGTGTFKPLQGTNPFIGREDHQEQVREYRLETIVPGENLHCVVTAMLKAHPYEEVAYDIYRLENDTTGKGLGRVGRLQEPCTLRQVAAAVAAATGSRTIRIAGDLERIISKVAVCGGSGASLIAKAASKGADMFLTGDVKYHEAQEALAQGLALIDAGHYATEQAAIPLLAKLLQREFSPNDLQVYLSRINTDPWVSFSG